MSQSTGTRRGFLKLGAALGGTALSTPFIARNALAAEPIKVGCLLDQSGPLGLSGQPMLQATQYAVKVINDQGGLLGRPLQLVVYDTQSSMQLYTQYAQQLALKDKVAVVHGGITSASREAIRPIFDRFKTLYFYNTQYEGGVCDRDIFCTGTTPAQTVSHIVPYALKNWGKKTYIIAADYNYGHITAKWMTKYTREGGGQVLETDFFPLDVTDFSATISKIQQASPDFVLSPLVGANHLGFYRQWAAAGMKSKIPVASSVFGLSNELNSMDASVTDGIISAFGWYPTVPGAGSKSFLDGMTAMFGKGLPMLSELDSASYEGMMFWAEGVKKAGTIDRLPVIKALESGITIDGPSGKATMDPATHHVIHNAYLAKAEKAEWVIQDTYPASPPADTAAVCDLIKNPRMDKQFIVNVD
ncbi:transporter substrate-binding protein [Acidisoma cellulosilytica]|uniref:Transporter substrate-binding protein n=1 Tax=Acidisoma cellulosilyticum TaxID=2802395 RepID=A0A964E6X2_9PROT|nr:ABC transporter substrate-binding protein [Acidisoma cellulosilyticum]MCB8883443.1 transporter substrate-binding protein [Acidisoma cellulosilyticum]